MGEEGNSAGDAGICGPLGLHLHANPQLRGSHSLANLQGKIQEVQWQIAGKFNGRLMA